MQYGWPTYSAVDCILYAFEVEKLPTVSSTIANTLLTRQDLKSFIPQIRFLSSNEINCIIKVGLFAASKAFNQHF